DRVSAYGGPVGRARVAWTSRGGVVLLASHQRVLAGRSAVDEAWLACQLLDPVAPRALVDRLSAFTGVRLCPPGTVVTLCGAGGVSERRWWRPPHPSTLDLREGARRLRAGLESTVSALMRGAGSMGVSINNAPSCALAVLAGRVGRDVAVLALGEPVDLDMDGVYYRAALGQAGWMDHRRFTVHDLPSFAANLDRVPGTDEPSGHELAAARVAHVVDASAGWGAGTHLSGFGGNDVLLAPHSYLHRLGGAPAVAQRHLHGWAYPIGMTPAALRALLDAEPDSYPAWLRSLAGSLDSPPPYLITGWEPRVWLAPWVSGPARAVVRELLVEVARDAEPLAEFRDQHAAVAALQVAGCAAGAARDFALRATGIPLECPYLDLGVVEACLATGPEVRTDPWRGLPLLTAAVPGLVEPEVEHRAPGPTYDVVEGLSANRHTLDGLISEGALTGLGLVDPDLLRPYLKDPGMHEPHVRALIRTLAVETWLRTI
ncbi:MAG TPA: asparagine synthase-related protein, partial [Mycobacteriales bacterium]|nr:asparagine synthase-related protein [Mycobacteriales bacterium]